MVQRIKQDVMMQITRNNHLQYMVRLTPCLILLYFLQILAYRHFASPALSQDLNIFLGVGLASIIALYYFYDHHHKITCRENYLETRFDILKMKEEVLYQNVVHIEVKKTRFSSYGKVTLHSKDGNIHHLHHVDSPELIKAYIEQKRSKSA